MRATDARLSFRLSSELKKTIEDVTAQMGQTVGGFAISTLVQASRRILHVQQVTRLMERDRRLFVEMLDNESAKPNAALTRSVQRYKVLVRVPAGDGRRKQSQRTGNTVQSDGPTECGRPVPIDKEDPSPHLSPQSRGEE